MLMTVVDVGKVRMFVAYRLMHMPMRVRLTTVIRSVLVLVMFIVDVPVMMGKGLVRVIMYMALGKVKPDTDPHHHRSDPKKQRRLLAEQRDRDRCPDEGGRGKVRARPRGPQTAQRQHK